MRGTPEAGLRPLSRYRPRFSPRSVLRPYKRWSVPLQRVPASLSETQRKREQAPALHMGWRPLECGGLPPLLPTDTTRKMPALRRPLHNRSAILFFSAIKMTGKRHYLTTLGAWHRNTARFTNSHWLALSQATPTVAPGNPASDDATPILVLIEADEGAHLALEDDTAFEALPHPLAQKPISETAQTALAAHGVATGATMFDAAEAVARVHPLLRHRVF